MTDDNDPLAPYDFALPDERIARVPTPERDAARMLCLDEGGEFADRTVRELTGRLRSGDVLVVNDVRVHPARLRARRATGGHVEVLLVRPGAGTEESPPVDAAVWEALVRPAKKLREGEILTCGEGTVTIVSRLASGAMVVRCEPDVTTLTASAGEVPLPPYMGRAATADDVGRYQTVYARPGMLAAAAPTAGLHLTPRLLAEIDAIGVERVNVTLEVGLGTFQPLRDEQLASGKLHDERFFVPPETWAVVQKAKLAGRRVVAVGTTSVRVLESMTGPGAGSTTMFIRDGYRFHTVDALLTNFHLPRSSLLMLVSAFGGRERVLSAYHHALGAGYRFYSYGDCMFLTPATATEHGAPRPG